ncbi:MAG TPA: ABC transporter ATP-binding protein [Bacteroidia bacterium]|nr:ABC transporter ATP-binding protein [Bacteroidia bacterium]
MLLQVKNLSLTLATDSGPADVLKNVSLGVESDKCTAVVGESGSGKTLTSLAVMGLLPMPVVKSLSGEIIFNSPAKGQIDLLQLKPGEWREIRGKEIAMIFQEPMTALNPVYTCKKQLYENIGAGKKLSKKQIKKTAFDLLEEVKLREPGRILNSYPHEISGGQRQRVMIAMALAQNPALLIADEPTTALDVTVQAAIIDLLKELQQKRRLGILFISHDLSLVKKIADTVAVMYKGNVVENNASGLLFNNPQHIYTRALLQCSPAANPHAEVLPVLRDFFEETPDGLMEKQTAIKNAAAVEKSTNSPEPLITIKNLEVEYKNESGFSIFKKKGGKKTLKDISLDIYKGETLAVVGESGSGKTTLGMSILQTTHITGGTIVFNNQRFDLSKLSGRKAFRQKFQLVFQDPYSSLNPRISIGSQVEEAVKNFHPKVNSRQRTNELLEMVGLTTEAYNKYPHEFSGGQRQRICIARALAPNPEFLVLDEAVSALDVSVQAQVLNLLKKLQRELGLTYFFITHDLNVARFIANRILVIQHGEIVELQDKDQLFASPKSGYTQQLLEAVH